MTGKRTQREPLDKRTAPFFPSVNRKVKEDKRPGKSVSSPAVDWSGDLEGPEMV